MEEVNCIFQTDLTLKELFLTVKLLGEVDLLKQMVIFMKETLMEIKQKAKEHLEMQEEYIKVNLKMEKFMEMGNTKEKMVFSSKEDSRMVSNRKVSLFGDHKTNIHIKVC
jgi:hypothetical protein